MLDIRTGIRGQNTATAGMMTVFWRALVTIVKVKCWVFLSLFVHTSSHFRQGSVTFNFVFIFTSCSQSNSNLNYPRTLEVQLLDIGQIFYLDMLAKMIYNPG